MWIDLEGEEGVEAAMVALAQMAEQTGIKEMMFNVNQSMMEKRTSDNFARFSVGLCVILIFVTVQTPYTNILTTWTTTPYESLESLVIRWHAIAHFPTLVITFALVRLNRFIHKPAPIFPRVPDIPGIPIEPLAYTIGSQDVAGCPAGFLLEVARGIN